MTTDPATGKRVALALGSGGARGYAHIGVIQELEEHGFEIVGIAGSSMGALIGGLHAVNGLDEFADWAVTLTQRDVLRMLDPTLMGPGMVRAAKIFGKLGELVGDVLIEDLPIPYTAVAADLTRRKEVWFQRGRLDAAIRASSAIPGVITPVVVNGRLLADGGLVDPLPVVATAGIEADVVVGVGLAGEHLSVAGWPDAPAREEAAVDDEEVRPDSELVRTLNRWMGNVRSQLTDTDAADAPAYDPPPAGLKTRDVVDLSLDTLRSVVAKYRLAGYPPDVLITIPRDAGGTLDFHRAADLIALGRERTKAALQVG
ncbi:NTE family protein [Ilumatobacter fluminis]|uniref:NTE family protein n=1 Tax=Ilumatobacter fluminis TaxID=467091 RepID=A0A4R7I2S0_9ACTN|nr:patatin-like phospholipase family protein [Ilumatobacter fluminis]TDT17189.1 NTE family protein [Ilumatobacter fluminis]